MEEVKKKSCHEYYSNSWDFGQGLMSYMFFRQTDFTQMLEQFGIFYNVFEIMKGVLRVCTPQNKSPILPLPLFVIKVLFVAT